MTLPAPTVHVDRDQYHLAWDRAIEPVATVASGTVVEIEMLDASCGQITAASTADDLRTLDFSRVNPAHGPIAVEGAEPGDSLEIELLDFQPASWGWTASIPGFGLLADDFPDPALRITPLLGETAAFLPGISVSLAPFCGGLGVAPAGAGPHSTIPPAEFGGNMDTRHLTAGATLFLPVFAPGGRFSMGDGHAAQGDGEVCGTAIETPMRALVRLSVRKGLKITAPEFVTPGPRSATTAAAYGTDGVAPDLMTATRDAVRRMIEYLGRDHGGNNRADPACLGLSRFKVIP